MAEKAGGNKLHYGWVIFGACTLMVFVSLGFCSSVKSLYLAPVTEDTGLSRSMFSLNDVCRYAVVGVMNMFLGFFLTKAKPRALVAFGFLALSLSQLVYSLSNSALVFCFGGVLLGIGLAWTTTTISGYLVEKWFTSNKGAVMGIILAANGLGASLSSQILSPIISSSRSGWRSSYRLSALIVLTVGLIVVSLLRNDPADMKLAPMGSGVYKKKEKANAWAGIEDKTLLRKPYFWLTLMCTFLYGVCLQAYSSSSSAFFRDIGLDSGVIANVLSIFMILLALSKISAGAAFDRFGLTAVLSACSFFAVSALVVLSLTKSAVGAYIYAAIGSLGLPIETVLMPLLTMELFGQKSYAKIMGIVVGTVQFGYCAGSYLVNLAFDALGTYRPVYLGDAVITVANTAVMLLIIRTCHNERKKLEAGMSL